AATVALMEAPQSEIYYHTGYNIAAFSATPAEMAESIRKFIPEFQISYRPDFRQEIADSWPDSIDDRYARDHDHWQSKFSLDDTTKIMLDQIRKKA
ncbi:MAG TPA: NAD-dependent epimerase, partial [Bacteroidales bacterium]|nr:NAD-dependent epimerase [Bacteroidales bacterium]